MSGVKGRSGRRPLSIEMKRLQTIDKAWQVTHDYLHSDATPKEKVEQAIKIVTRDIPEQHQHSGSLIVKYGHRTTSSPIRDKSE